MKWLNDHFIIHRKDKWMAIIDVSISYKRPQKEKKGDINGYKELNRRVAHISGSIHSIGN